MLRYASKTVLSYLVACLGYGAIAIFAALFLKLDGFDFIRLLALGAFFGGFLLFAIFAAFSAPKFKLLSKFFIVLCLLIVLIGVDAFLIEPHWLEIDRTTLQSTKIKQPIRLAILTDLQTEKVGDYEKNAIKKMLAEKPDLILFPGDYVQSDGSESRINSRQNEIRRLNELFRNEKLAAPLGIFAVHGNCEDDSWPVTFSGLPSVTCFTKTSDAELKDLEITGLTLDDSFDPNFQIKHSDKFHIVVGHGPDFALGNANADLLVAGHTHGGQVQVPFFGPPITLCRAPREWARGCITELRPGTTLIVSRGVGMERNNAPRMRFLCRPQIIIVNLVPAHQDVVPLQEPLVPAHQDVVPPQ